MLDKYYQRFHALHVRETNFRSAKPVKIPYNPLQQHLTASFVKLLHEIDIQTGFKSDDAQYYLKAFKQDCPTQYADLIVEYFHKYPEMQNVSALA